MTTVLIASDKFKGSLSAAEVADSLSRGLVGTGMDVVTLPLADGGDGSVAAAVASGFDAQRIVVADATGTPHGADIAVRGDTAVVEIANTCGLATLPAGRLAPMSASSYGFGQAIRHAIDCGARRVVLALGGSASSDAGIGVLAALGFRFFDHNQRALPATTYTLPRIHTVVAGPSIDADLVVASDVTNPLLGPNGAAAVYGPQKGAGVTHIDALESGYENLVAALVRSGWADAHRLATTPGAGAAGGCGFAAALLGARITSGADYFLDLFDFDSHCAAADLVITGEGRLDHQTLNGKLPAVVAKRAHPTPVIAVVGVNVLGAISSPFLDIFAAADHSSTDTAHDPAATRLALAKIGATIGRTRSSALTDH